MMLFSLMVLTTTLLGADAAKEDQAKNELDKLQGEWALLAIDNNGTENKLMPDDVAFKLKGEVLSVKSSKGEYGKYAKIRLDPTKKPKAMDVTVTEGQEELAKCIYELDGDNLKVAYLRTENKSSGEGIFADQRPSSFKMKPVDSPQRPHLRILVLKRIKS
jgi:uncharacterized protein (TIGR03067 family)